MVCRVRLSSTTTRCRSESSPAVCWFSNYGRRDPANLNERIETAGESLSLRHFEKPHGRHEVFK